MKYSKWCKNSKSKIIKNNNISERLRVTGMGIPRYVYVIWPIIVASPCQLHEVAQKCTIFNSHKSRGPALSKSHPTVTCPLCHLGQCFLFLFIDFTVVMISLTFLLLCAYCIKSHFSTTRTYIYTSVYSRPREWVPSTKNVSLISMI